MQWFNKAGYRRLAVAILGVLVVVGQETLGLDPEQLQQIGLVVITWILGDSIRPTGTRHN